MPEVDVLDSNAKDLVRSHTSVLHDDENIIQRLFTGRQEPCFTLEIKKMLTLRFIEQLDLRCPSDDFPFHRLAK